MKTIRRVVGRSNGQEGCVARLAMMTSDEARDFGLEVIANRVSRSRGHTISRYIELADGDGRRWHLRLSNHYRPKTSRHAPPHFDLVSLDGSSGLAEIRKFLVAIASGEAEWWDRARCDRKPAPKRRRNNKRFCGRDRRR